MAQAMIDAFNEAEQETMLEMAELYDPDIPVAENEAYVARVRARRGA